MGNVGKRWENKQDGQCGREIEIWIMWETDGKIDRIANVGEKQ